MSIRMASPRLPPEGGSYGGLNRAGAGAFRLSSGRSTPWLRLQPEERAPCRCETVDSLGILRGVSRKVAEMSAGVPKYQHARQFTIHDRRFTM
jgi:hypothetical protein